MANIIQQLEDLKEWSQNPERYERRLAFRGSMGTEAGTIPAEFDELSPQEQQYYQNPPFSTHQIFLALRVVLHNSWTTDQEDRGIKELKENQNIRLRN